MGSEEIGTGRVVVHGVIGGMFGGMAMGMTSMMGFPLLHAGGFWQPLNLIAAVANPAWGEIPGFSLVPVMVGMGIHMMTSAGLGVVAALSANATGRAWLPWSLGVGMIAWASAQFVALPLVDSILVDTFPLGLFAVAHAMFGVALGLWLTGALTGFQVLSGETRHA
jgi:hypothetical protein